MKYFLYLLKFLLKFIIVCIILGAVVTFFGYQYYSKNLPDVTRLKDVRLQTPMQVLSSDGELIATFGEYRRLPLKYEDIPPVIINAIIATEDSRFYEHIGVDPIGIVRAMYIAFKNHKFSQGGSTITQQVAKNFFLTPERNFGRKVREMILALRMEKELSKEEIIALYLNMIDFGSRSYGIGSAAFTFYGKDAKDLTLSEAALLAGLPNAPSAYNPISHPKKALQRRNWVLLRMLKQQFITQEQYDEAISEPLNVGYYAPKIAFSAPYVAEMARQFMFDKFGKSAYTDGYKVYTTISRANQIAANTAMHDQIINYDMRHGYRGPEKTLWKPDEVAWNVEKIETALNNYSCYQEICPAVVTESDTEHAKAILNDGNEITIDFEGVKWARSFINDSRQGQLPKTVSSVITAGQQIWVKKQNNSWMLSQIPTINGALVSINSEDGAIKALIGGFDYNISKFNRATQAIRQIGSTIKPFIYAAALDKGLTLATILNDAPIMRSNAGSEAWRPKNSPAVYAGPLRLRIGLSMSKNVMMVRTLRAIGVNYAANYLERFGFPHDNISRNESLALGSASFTPLQVARAYSVIANGGYLITPYLIDRIEYSEGGVIYQHQPELACKNNCLTEPSYKNDSTEVANLDNVENATQNNEQADEPEQQKLKADDNMLLPRTDIPFRQLINPDGTVNFDKTSVAKQQQTHYAPHVISNEISFLIKDALKSTVWGDRDNQWRGTASRSRALGRHDIGGKTGTTNLSKDVWFSGFAPNLTTTVWLGFDDHRRELGRARQNTLSNDATVAEAGGNLANPIWNNYMQEMLKNVPEQPENPPASIISVLIDKKTGLLAPQPNSNSISEYFIEGTEPTKYATKEVGTKVTDEHGGTTELF